jgi:hypothetical protein
VELALLKIWVVVRLNGAVARALLLYRPKDYPVEIPFLAPLVVVEVVGILLIVVVKLILLVAEEGLVILLAVARRHQAVVLLARLEMLVLPKLMVVVLAALAALALIILELRAQAARVVSPVVAVAVVEYRLALQVLLAQVVQVVRGMP